MSHALLVQEKFWQDKTRSKWLRDGDRNTSYFHTFAKIHRTRNFISSLHIDSELVEEVEILRNHVVEHFFNAFHDDGLAIDTGLVTRLIPPLVTTPENDTLLAIPTLEEIKQTVFSMNPDSAPGPDGFGGAFFHACWDFVGFEVFGCPRFLQDRLYFTQFEF